MKPEYTARYSILNAFTIWRVLLFWLIVPTIMIIVDIVKYKHDYIEFYDSYVVHKFGVIAKNEKRSIFPTVLSVSVYRTFWGAVFNYASIKVDVIGSFDLSLCNISNPDGLKSYLESKIMNNSQVKNISNKTMYTDL